MEVEAKYIRDPRSNTLINTDVDAFQQYKHFRNIDKQFRLMQKRIDELENLVQTLNEKIGRLEQNG